MKFGCNSFIAPGESWQEKFSNLDEIGCEGIEIRLTGDAFQQDQQIKEILSLTQNVNVKPCSLVRPTPTFLRELTQESLKEKIEDVAIAAEYAAILGVPALVSVGVSVQQSLPSPFLPLMEMNKAKRDLLKLFLYEIEKIAIQKNSTLLIEPLNRYEGSYYHKLSEAVEILNEVGSHQIGILADVFHINIEESNTFQAIICTKGMLKHIQLGDNNRLLPGEGQFDFKQFFKAVNQIEYSGYLAFECIAPIGQKQPLKTSIKYLKNICKELGC